MILNATSQKVLQEMMELEKQFDAQFAVDEATGLFLYQLVLCHQPKRILELGTWRGASAIYMAVALKRLGGGHLFTVDIGNDRVETAKENFIKAGVEKFVSQVVSDISPFLQTDNTQYDMVFMDATKYEQVGWLEKLLERNLGRNSLIVIDDAITMKDKMRALYDFVDKHPDLVSKVENVGDGLMVVEYKNSRTVYK